VFDPAEFLLHRAFSGSGPGWRCDRASQIAGEVRGRAADLSQGDTARRVGLRTRQHRCRVAEGARIGDDFYAHSHAVVRENCRIGNNVVLQNGVVVGGDGFGFAKDNDGHWHKIVQSGPTVIEDDVEIQANAWLNTDPRRRLKDVKAHLRFDYSIFKERRRRDRKYLLAGGMSNEKITSYFNRLESRTKAFLTDDQKLRTDPSFYGDSFIIVSGTKGS